jgi:glycosyltransferase 2 family protein
VRVLRVVVTVAVLAALGLALANRWDEVRGRLGQVSPAAVAGALACCLLALLASMLAWRALLADLGSPLPVGAATRVLFLGQLAKYLPGSSVWAVVAQTELARDFGVPRRRAAAAALVLNLVTLGVGLVVALLALPRLLSGEAPGWLHWTPLLVPVGLACLTPPVLTFACNLLFRVLRRPPLDVRFSWTGIGVAVLALLGTWLAYGLQITLLGWSLGADPASLLLPATGAFAAAWCAGFLVVVVPTGAGTREAVLTLALAAQLPGGSAAALTIAVVSRLLLTLADVAAALIGAALGRRRARVPPGPPADPAHPADPAGPADDPADDPQPTRSRR